MSTMAWIGVRPGDVHLAISSPGWAKHAWSCFFAPWIAEATIFVYNYARFDAADAAARRSAEPASRTFCAPPTVWRMLIQSDLGDRNPKALREILGAGEPLNPDVIAPGRDGVGADHPRRLRADRDHPAGRQHPGPARQGRIDGPADARRPGGARRPASPGELADEGEICLDLATRPLNLMTGYLGDPKRNDAVMAAATTTPVTSPAVTTTATSPTSAAPTTSSSPRTTRCRRSSWRAC